jgi:DtxR family transcriptional regulator, Mn-dependent transcriptional regulator
LGSDSAVSGYQHGRTGHGQARLQRSGGVTFWDSRARISYAKILIMAKVRSFSPAVEDYLKAVYRLQAEAGCPVTTNALGDWLGVTASSASGMLRKLDDLGLVVYEAYRGVRLSDTGWRAAMHVVRRHRLLELFLSETLGLAWDQVHDEAEALEHALSPGLCDVIAAKLGDPRTDPHGDPIPTKDGQVLEAPSASLGSLRPGDRRKVVRVSDRDPEVLRQLTDHGVALGDSLCVTDVDPSGAVTVDVGSVVHLLDRHVVAAVWVEAAG